MLPKLRFEVVPGRKSAFSQNVGLAVEDIVENCQAQIWLTNVVNVRKHQAYMCADSVPILQDLVVLTTNVTPRLFDVVKYFFELFRVYCLQEYLSNIEFVFYFRQGNVTEIVFNQSNHLREIPVQLGTIEPNFRDLQLGSLPAILVGCFNNG